MINCIYVSRDANLMKMKHDAKKAGGNLISFEGHLFFITKGNAAIQVLPFSS